MALNLLIQWKICPHLPYWVRPDFMNILAWVFDLWLLDNVMMDVADIGYGDCLFQLADWILYFYELN